MQRADVIDDPKRASLRRDKEIMVVKLMSVTGTFGKFI